MKREEIKSEERDLEIGDCGLGKASKSKVLCAAQSKIKVQDGGWSKENT
jgi:hypothetical protein